MQQFFILLSWRLFTAQHVSGVFPPIIRSSVTAVAASGFTFISWWQSCCVRGRASRPDFSVSCRFSRNTPLDVRQNYALQTVLIKIALRSILDIESDTSSLFCLYKLADYGEKRHFLYNTLCRCCLIHFYVLSLYFNGSYMSRLYLFTFRYVARL
jgi:hypothetical protein